MNDNAMLFEEIVLGAFGAVWQGSDPLGLGDAGVFGMADNELTGKRGYDVKVALSAALRAVAKQQNSKPEIRDRLLELEERVYNANSYGDIVEVMKETKDAFASVDITITH